MKTAKCKIGLTRSIKSIDEPERDTGYRRRSVRMRAGTNIDPVEFYCAKDGWGYVKGAVVFFPDGSTEIIKFAAGKCIRRNDRAYIAAGELVMQYVIDALKPETVLNAMERWLSKMANSKRKCI